jgi:hypothetical protein
MAEDLIAQGEIAALTRRYENALQIVRGDIAAMDNRLMTVEEKLDGFITEQRAANKSQQTANAQIIELLSGLVGRTPNAS